MSHNSFQLTDNKILFIIVHSISGITLEFAKHIAAQLKEKKHSIDLIHFQLDPEIKSRFADELLPLR